MSLTTVPVSISAMLAAGVPLAGGLAHFELTAPDKDGTVVVPSSFETTLDAGGLGTVNAWPNARGVNGTQYRVMLYDAAQNLQLAGVATVPNSACNLHDILSLVAPAKVSDAQAAATTAQTAAAQAVAAAAQAQAVVEDTGFIAVKNDLANIDAVAGDLANVNTVAGAASDVNVVASNVAAVQTVVANLPAIESSAALATSLGASGGALMVGYKADNGSTQTVQAKLRQTPTAADFGITGSGTENAAVLLAEGSTASTIDLQGLVVTTTLASTALHKTYTNGVLITSDGAYYVRPLTDRGTKSPEIDWSGKNVLWLGTSIPNYNKGVDSYPDLFASTLGCTVVNNAWPGSHAYYNVAGDPNSKTTIDGLSMTDDDRVAGLALYGPSSAYSDTFDATTKASQMTCDYRIKSAFQSAAFDVVWLEHARNDRQQATGVLGGVASAALTGVTKGATTVITTSLSLAVGDAVALEITGIPNLHNFCARVQSVGSGTATLNLDSSAYSGSFTAGTARKLDRSTFYGAMDFLIRYIRWAAYQVGANPFIILSSPPTQYTDSGIYDNTMLTAANWVAAVAKSYSLPWFDITASIGVTAFDHLTYFPDGTHPATSVARRAMANHYIAWSNGGRTRQYMNGQFLPGTSDQTYTEQREAMYSRFLRGYGAPKFILADPVVVLNETFASGGTGWSFLGTAPVVGAAPWNAAEYAIHCVSTAVADASYVRRDLAFDAGLSVEWDLWLPAVAGLTTDTNAVVELLRLGTAAGSDLHYGVQLVVSSTDVTIRAGYFTGPANAGHVNLATSETKLQANHKHHFKFEAVRGTASYPGMLLLWLDGVLLSPFVQIADSSLPAVGRVYAGVISSTTLQNLDVYMGNLFMSKMAASDYSTRYTGTVITGAGDSLSVVNGVVVSKTLAASLPSYTWTGKPAASSVPAGYMIRVSDVGLAPGSRWVSDGAVWRPDGIVVLDQLTVGVSGANDTNENTLRTVTVPGGVMGTNGRLRVTGMADVTNSANNKVLRLRFPSGGTQVLSITLTTQASYKFMREIINRNSASSQVTESGTSSGGWGTSSPATTTTTVDTSVDTTLVFTVQKTLGTEAATLSSLLVELIP